MKISLFILAITFSSLASYAQFTAAGKVTYERRISVRRMYSELYGDKNYSWYNEMKDKLPQVKVRNFELYFNTATAVFKPVKVTDDGNYSWIGATPVDDDVIYTDFAHNKVVAAKDLYGDKFIIEDTLKHIQWKIGSEIRTIANFKCRKAVGKIYDSVYIVAFYADGIPVSGGPELFSSLPGMILELSIPRLYTTWVATTVDITPLKADDLTMPKTKGKKVNYAEMANMLETGMKNRGDWAQRFIWWGLL